MAEYSSLYIKIEISEEKLNQFFHEKPLQATLDDEWTQWWDSREMHGKQALERLPAYLTVTNRAVFDELLQGRDYGATERYDSASQSWIFISVFFSENYHEILPMLSLLKSLAAYQESTQQGVALIYDFCWGHHEVMAYLDFIHRQAKLQNYTETTQIARETMDGANRDLETAVTKFNQQFEK